MLGRYYILALTMIMMIVSCQSDVSPMSNEESEERVEKIFMKIQNGVIRS